MTLTNRTPVERVIELTTYFEIVIAAPESDITHPAFSNLFVQTEFIRDSSAILATRRARSAEEHPPWLLHLLLAHDRGEGEDPSLAGLRHGWLLAGLAGDCFTGNRLSTWGGVASAG